MAKDEERFIQIMREASELTDDFSVKHFFNSLADIKEQSDIVDDNFALNVSFMAYNDAWSRLNHNRYDTITYVDESDIKMLLDKHIEDEYDMGLETVRPWLAETNMRIFNELNVSLLDVWNTVREIKSQEMCDSYGFELQGDDSHSDFKNFLASNYFLVNDVVGYMECSPMINPDKFYNLMDKLNISEDKWIDTYEKVNLNIVIKVQRPRDPSNEFSVQDWVNIKNDFDSMEEAYYTFLSVEEYPKKICLEFKNDNFMKETVQTLDGVLEEKYAVEPRMFSELRFNPDSIPHLSANEEIFNTDIVKQNIKELWNLQINEPIQDVFVCYDKKHDKEPLIGIVSADDRKIGTDLRIQLFNNSDGNKVYDKIVNIQSNSDHKYEQYYDSDSLIDTFYSGLKGYHGIDYHKDISNKPIAIHNLPMKVKLAYNEITENRQNHIEHQSKNKDKNKACI